MKPDYFFAETVEQAKMINEYSIGWYFCLPLEEHWYGPFSTKGEASTEYQSLLCDLDLEDMATTYFDDSGFGMIELLIAVGLMAVVMAGVIQLCQVGLMSQTTIDVKTSGTTLNSFVSQVALDQKQCTAAITKTLQSYNGHIRFDLADNKSIIAPGLPQDYYQVYVKDFELKNATLVATGYEGTKVYYGSLVLTLGTQKAILGPNVFAPRGIGNIYLTVNPKGYIVSCGPVLPVLAAKPEVDDTEEIAKACRSIGGTLNGRACVMPKDDKPCDH